MALRFPDGRSLSLEAPRVMGILNVTPDSFSDGGAWIDPDRAVSRALEMAEEGAALIDVGGESTRPGAEPVPAAEQIERVAPVLERLVPALRDAGHDAAVSIDTRSAEVAEAALARGAALLNDVSAGRDDPRMLPLAAERGAPLVLMHMQGHPQNMQQDPRYDDVVGEVEAFLLERARAAQEAGIAGDQIVLDPGIGFGKRTEHNLRLLAGLSRLAGHGYPLLLGASRKRFMGRVGAREGEQTAPDDLLGATCGTSALAVQAGVSILRVHDVTPNRQAAEVAAAIGGGARAHISPR
jgi:dihydropteroate synthase